MSGTHLQSLENVFDTLPEVDLSATLHNLVIYCEGRGPIPSASQEPQCPPAARTSGSSPSTRPSATKPGGATGCRSPGRPGAGSKLRGFGKKAARASGTSRRKASRSPHAGRVRSRWHAHGLAARVPGTSEASATRVVRSGLQLLRLALENLCPT